MTLRNGISLRFVAIVVVVLVAAVILVYAFVLAPSSGPATTTTTTSAVSMPPNLFMATNQTPSSYCSQPSSPYSNSSLTINWGNLAPGTEGIQFVCLKNTGTTAITLAVNSSLPTSTGKVTSPQEGTILHGGAAELVELDLWLTSSVQPGPMQGFTVNIGGTQ
jgi:hypothetical protein